MVAQTNKRGKLIVIDGTDGSGKETQSKLLVDRLRSEDFPVEMVDFPMYGQPSAALVEMYLNGEFGKAEEVGPKIASAFYAFDRFSHSKAMYEWLNQGKIIISNRYVSSNKGHQAGKLKDPTKIDAFLKWLDHLEYERFKIPRPDKIILLHMPYLIGHQLVANKKEREYIKGKKRDIHEEDLDHLRDAEKAYLYVAEKEGWDVIKCGERGKPFPMQQIHGAVYKAVKKIL